MYFGTGEAVPAELRSRAAVRAGLTLMRQPIGIDLPVGRCGRMTVRG
jgi:hypothetical protein